MCLWFVPAMSPSAALLVTDGWGIAGQFGLNTTMMLMKWEILHLTRSVATFSVIKTAYEHIYHHVKNRGLGARLRRAYSNKRPV